MQFKAVRNEFEKINKDARASGLLINSTGKLLLIFDMELTCSLLKTAAIEKIVNRSIMPLKRYRKISINNLLTGTPDETRILNVNFGK